MISLETRLSPWDYYKAVPLTEWMTASYSADEWFEKISQ